MADAAGGELRGQIARTLASEYDADPASGGGLALGFTQQHPRLITGAGGVLVLAVGEARQAAIVA
ncbi:MULTISPECIES: hypothetical protein, partial [Enterobacterales]|uniref:hypothetical protein n=1 Tax=Enterobacterales TaxID=91347 RepID=UPI0021ABC7B6